MRKLNLFFFLFFSFTLGIAQNLVLNASFEDMDYTSQPTRYLCDVTNWFEPLEPGCSTDYYDLTYTNSPDPTYIPWILSHQLPRTGHAHIGEAFLTVPNAQFSYREYAETKLKTTLIANHYYCITYYVSLIATATYAIDNLCACLTNDSMKALLPDEMLVHCPLNNLCCNTEGNFIKDTLNWVKISLQYKAVGNENYLTIGNFNNNLSTNYIDTYYPNPNIETTATYYFIDDVAVYECNTPEYPANIPDQKPCKGETVTLGSPTRPQYLYEWKDAAGNIISTEGAITFVADTPTYYVLKQKDFKFDETTDTCFITVDVLCLNIPNVITPNNDGINDLFEVSQNPILHIDLQVFNRWGKRVFYSAHYQNNWPVTDIADGVYFYVLKATNPTGEVREYQGSVSVVR